jgi:hypothetical protein
VTFRLYVEETDDAANKVSQRPGARPAGERIANQKFTLPVITACKVVTYKRIGINIIYWGKAPVNMSSKASTTACSPEVI